MPIGTPVAGTLAENSSAAASLAVPYPAGITAGDLLLLVVVVSVNTVPNLPSGWDPLTSGASGTGSQSPAYRVSQKIATGSESGSQTVTMSSSTSHGQMYRISGADQTTPIDVVGTPLYAAIGVSPASAGVTTTMVGCQLWAIGVRNASSYAWDPIIDPFTMTEILDDSDPYPSMQVSYLTWSGSGATGTITFDAYSVVRSGGNVFAVRPAAAPPLVVTATPAAAEIVLTWPAWPGAGRFDVEIDGVVTTMDVTALTYTHAGLGASESHDYRVRPITP